MPGFQLFSPGAARPGHAHRCPRGARERRRVARDPVEASRVAVLEHRGAATWQCAAPGRDRSTDDAPSGFPHRSVSRSLSQSDHAPREGGDMRKQEGVDMRQISGALMIVALTSATSACGVALGDEGRDSPVGVTGAVTATPATATPGPASILGKRCTTVSHGATTATRCVVANHRATRLDRRPSDSTRLRRLASSLPASRPVAPTGVAVVCDGGASNPDRFTSCSDDFWDITETETVDGVTTVIGELPVEISASAQFGTDDVLNWTLSAEIITGPGEGTLSAGLSGTISTKCGARPDVCETDSSSDSEPIALEPETSTVHAW